MAQVIEKIVGVLETDGHPKEAGRRLGRGTFAGVSMLENRFDPPEARRVDDELQTRSDRDGRRLAAIVIVTGDFEGQDAAKSTHLARCDLVTGVSGKSGVVHRRDVWVLVELPSESQGRGRLPLHSHGE